MRRATNLTHLLSDAVKKYSFKRGGCSAAPVSVGELRDMGEPGTGISNAHRKPLTDSRTFWLSRGKF